MILARTASISGIVFGATFALTGMLQGLPFMILIGLLILFLAVYFCSRLFIIKVEEHEAVVLHNRVTGEFSRYLPTGLHIADFYEVVEYDFSTHPIVLEAEINGLRSADSIPHKVAYNVLIEPCPDTITAERLTSQIYVIARKFRAEARSLIDQSLRQTMGQFDAESLSHGNTLKKLERHFKADLERKFKAAGIKANRVSIGSILPPREFKNSLVEAQTRIIEANYVIRAMQMVQIALDQFSETDKQLLANWEIMRLFSGSDGAMFYSMGNQPPAAWTEQDADKLIVNPLVASKTGQPIPNYQRRVN